MINETTDISTTTQLIVYIKYLGKSTNRNEINEPIEEYEPKSEYLDLVIAESANAIHIKVISFIVSFANLDTPATISMFFFRACQNQRPATFLALSRWMHRQVVIEQYDHVAYIICLLFDTTLALWCVWFIDLCSNKGPLLPSTHLNSMQSPSLFWKEAQFQYLRATQGNPMSPLIPHTKVRPIGEELVEPCQKQFPVA